MDIPAHKPFKILLIGDTCIDRYHYVDTTGLSQEAPITVTKHTHYKEFEGMAYNVKANLEALRCEVSLVLSTSSLKVRYIDNKYKTQLFRVDYEQETSPINVPYDTINKYDAVVISDYNKGAVTYDIIDKILEVATIPVYIDTKKTEISQFNNCIIKINDIEYNKLSTKVHSSTKLIHTVGSEGAIYNNKLYPANKVVALDTCGAGDTFLASLVYFHLLIGDLDKAIPWANIASSITVQHIGVYAPTIEEILKLK